MSRWAPGLTGWQASQLRGGRSRRKTRGAGPGQVCAQGDQGAYSTRLSGEVDDTSVAVLTLLVINAAEDRSLQAAPACCLRGFGPTLGFCFSGPESPCCTAGPRPAPTGTCQNTVLF